MPNNFITFIFFEKMFQEYHRSVKQFDPMDPDHACHLVGSEVPTCNKKSGSVINCEFWKNIASQRKKVFLF